MQSTLPKIDDLRQHRLVRALACDQITPSTAIYVGLSGGQDSLLLALLLHIRYPGQVTAIHINHQLQAPANDWQQYVSTIADGWQLPLICQKVECASSETNIEASARAARFTAFADIIAGAANTANANTGVPQSKAILALAHHQQDQAETVLMRLFNGAGVQGLGAMHQWDLRNSHYNLWRPWLNCPITEIEDLVAQLGLQPIQDPANQDVNFKRVYITKQLAPLIRQQWPGFEQSICRSAQLMQDAQAIITEVQQLDVAQCVDVHNQLNIVTTTKLSLARQRQVIRGWMQGKTAHSYPPALTQVEAVRAMFTQSSDQSALVEWNQWQFCRYQQFLYRLPAGTAKVQPDSIGTTESEPVIFDSSSLQLRLASLPYVWHVDGMGVSMLTQQALFARARILGERFTPANRQGSHPLKKILQELGVPPWQRAHVRLLVDSAQQVYALLTPTSIVYAKTQFAASTGKVL